MKGIIVSVISLGVVLILSVIPSPFDRCVYGDSDNYIRLTSEIELGSITMGEIEIDLETGNVTIPKNLNINEASKNFWCAIEKFYKDDAKRVMRLQLWREITDSYYGQEIFKKSESTEIIVILDRSGSMETIKDDMEGGLKRFVENQKIVAGDANLTLIQFDTEYEIVYDSVDIHAVEKISLEPRGNTALLDAIGKTLNRSYIEKAICVIITDGLENSSETYTKPEVVRLIESRKNFGWQFIYLGANQDAMQEGSSLGISIVDCTTFNVDTVGSTLDTMSVNVTSFRDPNF